MNIIKYLLCKNSGMSNGESFLRASTNMPISGGAVRVIEKTVPFTDIITVTDALARPAVDLQSEITATQNLNGYEYPWVGGAGKNKLPKEYSTTTINGVTFTAYDDGSIKVNGTASGRIDYYISGSASGGSLVLPSGNYVMTYGDAQLSTNGLYMQYKKKRCYDNRESVCYF